MTIDEMRNGHEALECALLRVRHRHEKAGTPTSTRLGNCWKEASKELDEQLDEAERTGKDRWIDLLESK